MTGTTLASGPSGGTPDDSTRAARPAWRWVLPLIPVGLSGFLLTSLTWLRAHGGPGAGNENWGWLAGLVAECYLAFGFAPLFLVAVLTLAWSSIWFLTGRLDRPWQRLAHVAVFGLCLAVLQQLPAWSEADAGGALGRYLAVRMDSVFGGFLSVTFLSLATLAALLLATEFFFVQQFEVLAERTRRSTPRLRSARAPLGAMPMPAAVSGSEGEVAETVAAAAEAGAATAVAEPAPAAAEASAAWAEEAVAADAGETTEVPAADLGDAADPTAVEADEVAALRDLDLEAAPADDGVEQVGTDRASAAAEPPVARPTRPRQRVSTRRLSWRERQQLEQQAAPAVEPAPVVESSGEVDTTAESVAEPELSESGADAVAVDGGESAPFASAVESAGPAADEAAPLPLSEAELAFLADSSGAAADDEAGDVTFAESEGVAAAAEVEEPGLPAEEFDEIVVDVEGTLAVEDDASASVPADLAEPSREAAANEPLPPDGEGVADAAVSGATVADDWGETASWDEEEDEVWADDTESSEWADVDEPEVAADAWIGENAEQVAESVSEAEELADDAELAEAEEPEDATELSEAEELADATELAEAEELEDATELAEAEELEDATELADAEELADDAELAEAEELADDAELSEAEELADDAELSEAEELADATELAEAEELEDATELADAEELADGAELSEAEELADATELAEADAEELADDAELAEAEELVDETQLSEAEELVDDVELAEAEESEDATELSEAGELADATEFAEAEELDGSAALGATAELEGAVEPADAEAFGVDIELDDAGETAEEVDVSAGEEPAEEIEAAEAPELAEEEVPPPLVVERLDGGEDRGGEPTPVVEVPRPTGLRDDEDPRQGTLFPLAGDQDELLSEARALVVDYRRASRNFLARRLRVTPAEAERLLTELAREGVLEYEPGQAQGRVLV